MENIYEKAIDTYGIQSQTLMLAEECSELVKAASKACRYMAIPGDLHETKTLELVQDIAEEIADVLIMIEQIKMYYYITDSEIDNFKSNKLMRLAYRMSHDTNGN